MDGSARWHPELRGCPAHMCEGRVSATRFSEMTRREVGLAALGACLLAIVMTWPLIWHLGSTVPRDIGDPLAEAWQPAWGGHALLHQPLHFFDANRFWPTKYSLAFGDALIGYAPSGLIGSGPARGDGPLRPALHLRLRARLLRRLPARPRARARAGRSRDRRSGLRVRAVPARAGRPPAGDLERRDTAGRGLRRTRHPTAQPLVDLLGLDSGGLAVVDRLGAWPSVRVRDRGSRADRRDRVARSADAPRSRGG